MAASSVSTFLDVRQTSGSGAPASSPPAGQPSNDVAGKVLAAIHAGEEVVANLPAKTELEMPVVLSAVSWLAGHGLVWLDSTDGTVHAHLTAESQAALG